MAAGIGGDVDIGIWIVGGEGWGGDGGGWLGMGAGIGGDVDSGR